NYASNTSEGYAHPLLYNFFQPDMNGSANIAFPISNMEALLRYGDVNSTGLTSDLMRLLPTNLQGTSQLPPPLMGNPNSLIRNMVTTHSYDVDNLGLSPWVWDPSAPTTSYQLTAGTD